MKSGFFQVLRYAHVGHAHETSTCQTRFYNDSMLRYKSDILSMKTVWIINLLPVEKNSMLKDKLSKTWMSFRYLTKVLNQNFKTTVLFSSSTPITCRQCSGVVVCCWYLVRRWLLTKSDFQSIFISSLIQFQTVFFFAAQSNQISKDRLIF